MSLLGREGGSRQPAMFFKDPNKSLFILFEQKFLKDSRLLDRWSVDSQIWFVYRFVHLSHLGIFEKLYSIS